MIRLEYRITSSGGEDSDDRVLSVELDGPDLVPDAVSEALLAWGAALDRTLAADRLEEETTVEALLEEL